MKRPLTPEEEKLWEQVTSKSVPLHKTKKVQTRTAVAKKNKQVPLKSPPPNLRHLTADDKPLSSGSYAGIDRNTALRFRKGKYPIDGTLDLHGFTRDKAHAALSRFLGSHHERGSRCLLIITGKGLILRDMLPQWLSELQPIILAFDVAKQPHGGTGAFYILLKRKRHA